MAAMATTADGDDIGATAFGSPTASYAGSASSLSSSSASSFASLGITGSLAPNPFAFAFPRVLVPDAIRGNEDDGDFGNMHNNISVIMSHLGCDL
jgi:hypothetical protein